MNIILAKKLGDTFSLGLSGDFLASSNADSNCWHKSVSLEVLESRLLANVVNLSNSWRRVRPCTRFQGRRYITEVATGLNLILYFR